MNKEFINAINDLVKEKGISKEVLIEAIESALVSAYKKNYGTSQNVRVDIDQETGDINVYMRMDVVEDVEDDLTQISLEEAKDILRVMEKRDAEDTVMVNIIIHQIRRKRVRKQRLLLKRRLSLREKRKLNQRHRLKLNRK